VTAPVSEATLLIQRVAAATVGLSNRAAWAAIGELLEEAGVPSSDRQHARTAAWAIRAQLRRNPSDGTDGIPRHTPSRGYAVCAHARAPRGALVHGLPSCAVTLPAGHKTTLRAKPHVTRNHKERERGAFRSCAATHIRPTMQHGCEQRPISH
jgi:hypothetical protein